MYHLYMYIIYIHVLHVPTPHIAWPISSTPRHINSDRKLLYIYTDTMKYCTYFQCLLYATYVRTYIYTLVNHSWEITHVQRRVCHTFGIHAATCRPGKISLCTCGLISLVPRFYPQMKRSLVHVHSIYFTRGTRSHYNHIQYSLTIQDLIRRIHVHEIIMVGPDKQRSHA